MKIKRGLSFLDELHQKMDSIGKRRTRRRERTVCYAPLLDKWYYDAKARYWLAKTIISLLLNREMEYHRNHEHMPRKPRPFGYLGGIRYELHLDGCWYTADGHFMVDKNKVKWKRM